MNIGHHPELLDQLAARFALGVQRGGARRRMAELARQSATVRARILLWQERMNAMTELPSPQAGFAPSPSLWPRIEQRITADAVARRKESEWQGLLKQWQQEAQRAAQQAISGIAERLSWWRGAAWAGAVASVAAAGIGWQVHSSQSSALQSLQASVDLRVDMASKVAAETAAKKALAQAQQRMQYVAVLSDDKSAAQVLVTVDTATQQMSFKRVSGFKDTREALGKSLQLWAIEPGQAPKSLGLLGPDGVTRVSAQRTNVAVVPLLAISVEPAGGVPEAGGPTGPVVLKGPVLNTEM